MVSSTADSIAYCTIVATNYLPKALTLAQSLDEHHPGARLTVLLIDVEQHSDLPGIEGPVQLVSTEILGLPEREVLRLAAIYDIVEFATAVKPLLLDALLNDCEQAAYLDPDTFVTAPMVELPRDLAASEGGILLTPHYLRPVDGAAHLSEGHLLVVGVFNLGFCAVDRRSREFLAWWWGHLREECRWEPLSGLFVDQKWVDIGAALFGGTVWRHYGYNVSIANLHERAVECDDGGYYVAPSMDRLRLFHFHAFDTRSPEELSTRSGESTRHLRPGGSPLDALCVEYAARLSRNERELAGAPPYVYATDTRGRPLSRQLRRAYRLTSAGGDHTLPSPFRAADAAEFAAWRRRAWRSEARALAGDLAKSVRVTLPEEYERFKRRMPALMARVRGRYVEKAGGWR